MDINQFAVIFSILAVALSAFIHAAFGFGFPMTATPLLALQFDVQTAILYSLLPTMVVNIITIWYGRNNKSSILPFIPLALYSILGTIIGTQLLISFSPEPFRLFLAIIILIYLFKDKLAMHKILWLKKRQKVSMLIFGLLAGLVSGTTNIMIPVLLIYLSEIEVERNLMIRVMNLCFFSAKITQVIQFSAIGLLAGESLNISFLLSVVAIISIFIGFHFRHLIHDQLFDRFLRLSLYIMAIMLVIQFLINF